MKWGREGKRRLSAPNRPHCSSYDADLMKTAVKRNSRHVAQGCVYVLDDFEPTSVKRRAARRKRRWLARPATGQAGPDQPGRRFGNLLRFEARADQFVSLPVTMLLIEPSCVMTHQAVRGVGAQQFAEIRDRELEAGMLLRWDRRRGCPCRP